MCKEIVLLKFFAVEMMLQKYLQTFFATEVKLQKIYAIEIML